LKEPSKFSIQEIKNGKMTNRIKLSNIPSIYEATNSLRLSNLSNECIVSKSNYQSAMEHHYSNKDTIVDGPKT